MSQENAKKLIDMVSANEVLQVELKEVLTASSKEEVAGAFADFAAKNSCECTLLEFAEAKKAMLSELSPEDLAKIDGAGFPIFTKIGELLDIFLAG